MCIFFAAFFLRETNICDCRWIAKFSKSLMKEALRGPDIQELLDNLLFIRILH